MSNIFTIIFFRTLGRKCETNPWQEIFIIFSAHIKDNYLLFVSSRVFFFLYTLKQYFAITDKDRCNLCDTCKIYRKHGRVYTINHALYIYVSFPTLNLNKLTKGQNITQIYIRYRADFFFILITWFKFKDPRNKHLLC